MATKTLVGSGDEPSRRAMLIASGVVGIGVIWIGYRNRNHMVRMASRAAAPLMIPVLARFLADIGRLDVSCGPSGSSVFGSGVTEYPSGVAPRANSTVDPAETVALVRPWAVTRPSATHRPDPRPQEAGAVAGAVAVATRAGGASRGVPGAP